MPSPPPASKLWSIRLPASIALALCTYLLYQKMVGQISSLAGCGGASGCAQLLGGRWSSWFGIPITALAGTLYAGVLTATLPAVLHSRPAAVFLTASAAAALAAALWFTSVMAVVEKTLCPYCLAIHICGVAFALGFLISLREHLPHRRPAGSAVLAGLIGAGVLATGQVFGPAPKTYNITQEETATTTAAPVPAVAHTSSFLNGAITIDPASTPHIGNPEAEHVIAEYYDYTCKSCREASGSVYALLDRYPDKFLFLLNPCPLNTSCNRHFRGNSANHQYACDFARISLAVWRADPTKFPAFHRFLMEPPFAITPDIAKAQAAIYVGDTPLAQALVDPWIEQRLSEIYGHYALLIQKNAVMPKMLLGGTAVVNGVAQTDAQFIRALERHFNLP